MFVLFSQFFLSFCICNRIRNLCIDHFNNSPLLLEKKKVRKPTNYNIPSEMSQQLARSACSSCSFCTVTHIVHSKSSPHTKTYARAKPSAVPCPNENAAFFPPACDAANVLTSGRQGWDR